MLLIQVREDSRPALHEELCFLERLRLRPEQLTCLNVVTDPVPTWRQIDSFDLVLLGGAGGFAAYRDDAFTRPLLAILREIADRGKPFFGSCFGHQLLARALGGRVVADHAAAEVGTFDLELTGEGRRDPVFSGMPERFGVHLGHHDRVDRVPPGVAVLAQTTSCPCQAIRVPGKPVYSTQFHCEMSTAHMRERLLMYADEYLGADDPGAALEGILRSTEHVDSLLERFVSTYLA